MDIVMDGMSKYQRYRLKDLEAYRKRKRELAKTPTQHEKRRIYMIKWREKNREKHNQMHREYHARNKDVQNAKAKIRLLKYKYGLTPEDFENMKLNQNGRCGLCGEIPKESPRRSLHVDHSHETGLVRSLLCVRCNTMLGKIELVGIDKIIKYLREYNV